VMSASREDRPEAEGPIRVRHRCLLFLTNIIDQNAAGPQVAVMLVLRQNHLIVEGQIRARQFIRLCLMLLSRTISQEAEALPQAVIISISYQNLLKRADQMSDPPPAVKTPHSCRNLQDLNGRMYRKTVARYILLQHGNRAHHGAEHPLPVVVPAPYQNHLELTWLRSDHPPRVVILFLYQSLPELEWHKPDHLSLAGIPGRYQHHQVEEQVQMIGAVHQWPTITLMKILTKDQEDIEDREADRHMIVVTRVLLRDQPVHEALGSRREVIMEAQAAGGRVMNRTGVEARGTLVRHLELREGSQLKSRWTTLVRGGGTGEVRVGGSKIEQSILVGCEVLIGEYSTDAQKYFICVFTYEITKLRGNEQNNSAGFRCMING